MLLEQGGIKVEQQEKRYVLHSDGFSIIIQTFV